jgi:hypothetical protein
LLTSLTSPAKVIGILEQSWPSETTLKNLGCGFLGTEVTPTGQRMAKCEDIMKLTLWDAASDYLISAVLEQFWIFPKV